MTISENNFTKTFNLFLLLIASTIIFRKPCTWFIIGFVVFNLMFLKKGRYSKKALILGLVIASPFLLELIMFWNNSSPLMGLKSLEKSTSLLIFPLFILGNFQRIYFYKILKLYAIITTIIISLYFIRFIITSPQLILKYLHGIDLWEIGYVFSNTLGCHAPALNMHMAFVSICNLFFYTSMLSSKNITMKALLLLNFALSFFYVLLINTRMALLSTIVGCGIVFFAKFYSEINRKKIKKTIVIVFLLLTTIFFSFLKINTFMKEKYTTAMVSHIDKIGKLDQIKNPEIEVYSSLVTRLSIWKSTWELSLQNLPFGVGASDGKPELFKYYKLTNQIFLAKYQFPTHNQFLDFLLKFGVLGVIIVFSYILCIGYIGLKTKNEIILAFFVLFFLSNCTDDFLIRFDGIAFSGFWLSLFGSYWFQKKPAI